MNKAAMTTICAWCQRLLCPTGEWISVLPLPTGDRVTHGICPACKHRIVEEDRVSLLGPRRTRDIRSAVATSWKYSNTYKRRKAKERQTDRILGLLLPPLAVAVAILVMVTFGG